jgi:hypothetical protein
MVVSWGLTKGFIWISSTTFEVLEATLVHEKCVFLAGFKVL